MKNDISNFSATCPVCGNSMPIKDERVFKTERRFRIGYLMSHLLPDGDRLRACDGTLNPTLRDTKTGKVMFLSYSFSKRDRQLKNFKREVGA